MCCIDNSVVYCAGDFCKLMVICKWNNKINDLSVDLKRMLIISLVSLSYRAWSIFRMIIHRWNDEICDLHAVLIKDDDCFYYASVMMQFNIC